MNNLGAANPHDAIDNVYSQPRVEFRPLRLADIPQLQQVLWPDHALDFVADYLNNVLMQMANGRALGLIAFAAGSALPDPVAYGQITRWPHIAEISDLIVTPAQRSHGIGAAIIAELIASADRWGMTEIEIGAALSNPRALALYRRLGFHDARTVLIDLGSGTEPVIYLTLSRATPHESDAPPSLSEAG